MVVLTARPPMFLQMEIYALAALGGAALLTPGDQVGLPDAFIAPRCDLRYEPASCGYEL